MKKRYYMNLECGNIHETRAEAEAEWLEMYDGGDPTSPEYVIFEDYYKTIYIDE